MFGNLSMATTHTIRTVGSIPAKYVPRKRPRSRPSSVGCHRVALVHGEHEQKVDEFVIYSDEDEDAEDENDGEEDENSRDGGGYIALGGVPHHAAHSYHHSFRRKRSFMQKYQPVSHSFADYVLARSQGHCRLEHQNVNEEFGTRHMLTTGMFRERPIPLDRINKVFCSQWLSDHQIAMGTKCNKLMVYDVNTRQMDIIPSLRSMEAMRPPDQPCGIHSIEINPSRTLLATGALNSHDVAVYRLPTLDPVCVGEKAHSDWIFDMCWLDDQFLVSGSRDTRLALWKIDDETDKSDTNNLPNYGHIKPVKVKQCSGAEKVRAVIFNPNLVEIVALSLNAYVHVWDANRFAQKMSKKLPHAMENVCLTRKEDSSLYAIGSKSHTTLLDPRTLHYVKKVNARITGCGIRSVSFHGDVLTIGTGVGAIMFYDMRAGKYMESTMNSGRAVVLKSTKGWVSADDQYHDVFHNVEYTPAIYTHCYDWSGMRLFTAGGPLPASLKGNYAALWC
ncbi:DDB1- and CUL4-associated factor 12 homolog isoform X1 [Palaemon carinicauda]|uniref:DDB1- and CUL4-associated factor 12 homolog isoform X1 n=2 Tax=Palaemon carinicauda TaxID=392227 RepID=UPI0035B696DD